MDPILQIKHLTKHYPHFDLDDISFDLPSGCIMGLIGENGAGKSTTIKAICNMIFPDRGNIYLWGQELTDATVALKNDIGIVFDSINCNGELTIKHLEHITQTAYLNWDHSLFLSYLDRFSLRPDVPIRSFSKGMKTKLSIAIALSHHPKLLILDEATSGLDPVARDEILDLLLGFVQDDQHSVLIASHITSDLEKIADYITFIHEGKLAFCKQTDELKYSYGILRTEQDPYTLIDKHLIAATRCCPYCWEALVSDKDSVAQILPHAVIDTANLENIMLLFSKREHDLNAL